MSAVVIDSSIALSWCFEDEASPETDSLFERVRDEGAIVPGLWHLELSNVLLQAEKRGRISARDVATRLQHHDERAGQNYPDNRSGPPKDENSHPSQRRRI